MEAATPLHRPRVRTVAGHVQIDGLVVADEATVRLVRAREDAREDPAPALVDAIEIGARVLDREQTSANVEALRAELERATHDAESAISTRTEQLGKVITEQIETVFGSDNGMLTRELAKHFDDGSSAAVQHKVRTIVDEVLRKGQEEFRDRFFAADGQNPLADFKRAQLSAIEGATAQQDRHLRALHAELTSLKLELQGLRDEKQKQVEVADERERGTAKGRTYEEAVFEAIDAIAVAQGDDADAVGDLNGAAGRTGDVVVGIDGCRGPARGRIVFEAKDSRLGKPDALRQLDRALAVRSADFAILVVPSEDELPARTSPLREMNGDKMFVAFDPESGSRLALEVAYALARARVLMNRGGGDGLDAGALAETVERALTAMEEVRAIKNHLSGAKTSIDRGYDALDSMATRVRGHLAELGEQLAAAQAAGDEE